MSNRKDEEQHGNNSTSSRKKTADSRLSRYRNNGKFALVSAVTAVAIGLIALLPATTITSMPTTAIDTKMIIPTTHAAFAQQEQQHQSIPATKSTPSTPPKPSDQPAVANQYTFNPLSKPPNTINGCVQFGKELVGKSVPDYNLCDLIVYRQAPAVTRSDGMIMNNYSGMGHYIELIPAQNNINQTQPFAGTSISNGSSNNPSGGSNNAMTNASNVVLNNNTIIVAFGEFSLLDPEVVPVHKVLDKYNWTITTIHNHMLDESPKLLFMHWTVTGKAGDIVKQAKEAIMQTSTYSNSTLGQRVPSSAGP